MDNKVSDIPISQESVICIYCKSKAIIRKGFRTTKKRGKIQKYKCKDCRKIFSKEDGFLHMRNDANIITQALDEYFEGLSSRKCSRNLAKFSGISISHVSVLDWVRKYVLLVHSYTNRLNPSLGDEQLTDETTIKTNGHEHQFGIVLDKKTRFITATAYWNKKGCELTSKDIAELWSKAKMIKKPKKWKTDGHPSYREAFYKTFYSRYKEGRVEWEKNVTSKTKKYNSTIERLNRNLKDRIRTIYGFKATWSAPIILLGWVIYYNYIRPHLGLQHKTPAQEAGISLHLGSNNWLDLIRTAMRASF